MQPTGLRSSAKTRELVGFVTFQPMSPSCTEASAPGGMKCSTGLKLLAATAGSHGAEMPWALSALGGNLYLEVYVEEQCFFFTQNVMKIILMLALF